MPSVVDIVPNKSGYQRNSYKYAGYPVVSVNILFHSVLMNELVDKILLAFRSNLSRHMSLHDTILRVCAFGYKEQSLLDIALHRFVVKGKIPIVA
jgi:hypothetical protein